MSNNKTFLALGDSYTIGELETTSNRWSCQLTDLINKEINNIEKPIIIANTGWTTTELLTALDYLNIEGKFDYVSLLIGVNNQYRNFDISIYINEFERLLKYCIKYCIEPSNIFVVSIPNWAHTPFGLKDSRGKENISLEIENYNDIAKNICASHHIAFIDIIEISNNEDPKYLTTDSLHPSGYQYGLWANKIFEWYKNR
jgi:lysophospholipase L1-like esterase